MWRLLPIAAVFTFLPCCAQDPGQMAAMQAQQAAQQFQQDVLTQQNILNQQLATQAATDLNGYQYGATKPTVRVEPGSDANHITVRLKDRTRGALMFYTTDGWTPTPASTRYDGPLTLRSGQVLRAIAIAPGALRSPVTVWPAAMPGQPTSKPAFANPLEGARTAEIPANTVTLVFTAPVASKGLQVGDKLPVALGSDLIRDGKAFAPKGTAALVTVSQIDGKASFGRPAELTFVARSIILTDGSTLKLVGGERLEGEPHGGRAAALFFIPVIGEVNGALTHGEDAIIPQGAVFPAAIEWPRTETAASDPAR